MATAAETIKLALRSLKVLGLGQVANSAQQAEGLDYLNRLLRRLLGGDAAAMWINQRIDSAYEIGLAYPAQRLQCVHGAALTITLPKGEGGVPVPDGFRLNVVDASGAAATNNITLARNGWLINGAAANAVINTNRASKLYLFRADLGDWKPVDSLIGANDLPTPPEFDEGIALLLARSWRLGGQTLAQDLQTLADEAERMIRARYVKPPPLNPAQGVTHLGYGVSGEDSAWEDASDSGVLG